MQHIQWYPGHMTKALRMIEQNLKLVDGVIYVLDARCPMSCLNEKMLGKMKNKPVFYALNKCDLIESADLKRYTDYFKENYGSCAGVNSVSGSGKKTLSVSLNKLFAQRLEKISARGVNRPLRLMVAGIPNTGKSTLINMLCGSKKAATGNKAGVTRGKQWLSAGAFELLDTPGTMPPAFENQTFARRLAYVGSVNDSILDLTELSVSLVGELNQKYPLLLPGKYGIEKDLTPMQAFEGICRAKGCLLRGGELDFERGAVSFIDDFRKGRMGKIALD